MRSIRKIDLTPRMVRDRTTSAAPILALVLVTSFCIVTPGAVASPSHDREISLLRTSWFWSSVPPGDSGMVADHARINWYAPHVLTPERDLNPTLTADEGAFDVHPVLELEIHPPTAEAAIDSSDWTGIVQEVDPAGLDLSRLQAVEVWVNDFRRDHTATTGTLRLALGRFSEDAFWDPKNPPNGVLDTEDKNLDGRLDRIDPHDPSYLSNDEDTGLDRVHDPQEPGYSGIGSDPDDDNYRYNPYQAPNDHSRINNFENNGTDDPNARPDTEDLNQDGGWTSKRIATRSGSTSPIPRLSASMCLATIRAT